MKNTLAKNLALAVLGTVFVASGAMATSLVIDHGAKVLLVDGNADANVGVNLASVDVWDGYYLKYSVNGEEWSDVKGWVDVGKFEGGDVLDFALRGSGYGNTNKDEFYVLSNDLADDGFSAVMDFGWELSPAQAQQPEMLTSYYKKLCVAWDIASYGRTYSGSFALSFCNNDGLATDTTSVPEPATMFLFGTGLVGLACVRRREKAQK